MGQPVEDDALAWRLGLLFALAVGVLVRLPGVGSEIDFNASEWESPPATCVKLVPIGVFVT